MTGSTLRRLQELAIGYVEVWHAASDEGGESGGLPVRVQIEYSAIDDSDHLQLRPR
jgi:hypothetical protein